jgi:4'-phosphopantetheinyl transferase
VTAIRVEIMLAEADAAGHGTREKTLLPRLRSEERARYHAFTAAARRLSWLGGRALLLDALEAVLGEADPAALVTGDEGGVRYLAAELHLNLSHSGDFFAVALAPLPVGVDLERRRPRAVAGQAARLFCTREAARLAELGGDTQLEAFYRLWTLKEAACKAAQLSVWDGLRHACFDMDEGRARLEAPFPPGEWHFLHTAFPSHWQLAAALRGGDPEWRCRRRTLRGGWTELPLTGAGFLQG